jgi:hypothetical protein
LPVSQAIKRTPFAYTPTLTDEAVALSQRDGVFIFREARSQGLIGADQRQQDVFWQGFQRLLDGPAPKVRWQARPNWPSRILRRLAKAVR